MMYGVVLGMVVTLVFGVLPVLMAANVRPAIVLRPNETHLPRQPVPNFDRVIGCGGGAGGDRRADYWRGHRQCD